MDDDNVSPKNKKVKTTTTTTQQPTYNFNSNNWPKFLVATSVDNNNSLNNLNPFQLANAIDITTGGKITNVTRFSSGNIMLETNSLQQTQKLLNAKNLGTIPVNITPYSTLNFCKGVIKTPELKNCSSEEIVAGTIDQGVIASRRITIVRDSKTINTNTYILTFDRVQIPKTINIGYTRVKVEQYIPTPLRCTKCQKFGHHISKCKRAIPTCAKCSQPHNQTECNQQTPNKCANCQGDHPAFSKFCPKWKQEQVVVKLKITHNISFIEARKRVTSRTDITYANIAAKTFSSISTQTDHTPIQSLPKPLPPKHTPVPSTSTSTITSPSRRKSLNIPAKNTPTTGKPAIANKPSKSSRQPLIKQITETYNRYGVLDKMDTVDKSYSAFDDSVEPLHCNRPPENQS